MLNSIKLQIVDKYSIDAENEFIDAVFERKYNSFMRKREYDKKYYEKFKSFIKSEEDVQSLKQKLADTTNYLENLNKELFETKAECEQARVDLDQMTRNYTQAKRTFQILSAHHENLNLPPITPKELREIKRKLNYASDVVNKSK
jgi:septal ring factor EnvC (AmiA/AmiB activator)